MVYIFLAEGFEDIEALQTRDLLLRAGIGVKTVGVGSKTVKSAFGLTVTADIAEGEFDPARAKAVVFPGGMPGAANLAASAVVKNAIAFALEHNLVIGAICAAPGVVLAGTGALFEKRYTCYPGFEVAEGIYTAKKTERDGKLVTANGPAASADFAALLAGAVESKAAEDFIRNMYSK